MYNTQCAKLTRLDLALAPMFHRPDGSFLSPAEMDALAQSKDILPTPEMLQPCPDYQTRLNNFFLQFLYQMLQDFEEDFKEDVATDFDHFSGLLASIEHDYTEVERRLPAYQSHAAFSPQRATLPVPAIDVGKASGAGAASDYFLDTLHNDAFCQLSELMKRLPLIHWGDEGDKDMNHLARELRALDYAHPLSPREIVYMKALLHQMWNYQEAFLRSMESQGLDLAAILKTVGVEKIPYGDWNLMKTVLHRMFLGLLTLVGKLFHDYDVQERATLAHANPLLSSVDITNLQVVEQGRVLDRLLYWATVVAQTESSKRWMHVLFNYLLVNETSFFAIGNNLTSDIWELSKHMNILWFEACHHNYLRSNLDELILRFCKWSDMLSFVVDQTMTVPGKRVGHNRTQDEDVEREVGLTKAIFKVSGVDSKITLAKLAGSSFLDELKTRLELMLDVNTPYASQESSHGRCSPLQLRNMAKAFKLAGIFTVDTPIAPAAESYFELRGRFYTFLVKFLANRTTALLELGIDEAGAAEERAAVVGMTWTGFSSSLCSRLLQCHQNGFPCTDC
jgi:hypothetical protein